MTHAGPVPTLLIIAATLLLPISNARGHSTEWTTIPGGDGTRCALGEPYTFFHRPGDPDKIAIIFEGGGACWTDATCDPDKIGSYDHDVSPDDHPQSRDGIFDLSNPDNPVRDFTLVFAPTCTGDVLVGDSSVQYRDATSGEEPLLIHHNGYRNATAVIDWMFQHFNNPKQVLVTGWSAGAIPSPIFSSRIAEHYGDARVSHLADGAGAYYLPHGLLEPVFSRWNSEQVLSGLGGYEGLTAANLTFEDIYIVEGRRHPEIALHQYNTNADHIARKFLTLLGAPKDVAVRHFRQQGHAHIRQSIKNFRTYTAWGDAENIIGGYYDGILAKGNERRGRPLTLDRFYTYQVGDILFRDWFASIVAGEPVDDVKCDDCVTPQRRLPSSASSAN